VDEIGHPAGEGPAAAADVEVAAERGSMMVRDREDRMIPMRLIDAIALTAIMLMVGCEAPVNAPVTVEPTIEAGLVSPGAVHVDPNAVQVSLGKVLDTVEAEVEMTLRKIEQRAESRANTRAGRDSRQTVTTVALEGSGWPLVGVGVICLGAMVGWFYYKHKSRRVENWLDDITTQIKRLPPTERKLLTKRIDGRVRKEAIFKKWLKAKGLAASSK